MRTEKQHESAKRFAARFRPVVRRQPPLLSSASSWWTMPMSREEFTAKAREADLRMNAVSTNYEKRIDG